MRSTAAASSSSRTTTGTATLYGRFETHVHADGAIALDRGEQLRKTVRASRRPTRTSTAASGPTTSARISAQAAIQLDGEHVRTALEQRQGERAEAGADLEHRVTVVDSSASVAMRRAVLGSARKFWPRLFFGSSPCSASRRADRRRREQLHEAAMVASVATAQLRTLRAHPQASQP